ncbi:MAG: tetratricopeptide repeat protein [Chitinophagales bacterium]
MVRLLKYFLSVFVFCCFTACTDTANTVPKKSIDISQLTSTQKEAMIKRLKKPMNAVGMIGSFEENLLRLDSLILLEPHIFQYYHDKQVDALKMGDYQTSFETLEKSISIDSTEALTYYAPILLYYFRDYERALKRLEELDKLTPNQTDYAMGENIHYLKGLAHKQMGNYKTAIEELTKCMDIEKEAMDSYLPVYRGISYLRSQNYEAAIQDFDYTLTNLKDPHNTLALYYKSEALLVQGDTIQAKKLLEESLKWIQKGYAKREMYYEIFDHVSVDMVKDRLMDLE